MAQNSKNFKWFMKQITDDATDNMTLKNQSNNRALTGYLQ
jgi:hypothetical protein